MKTNLTFTQLLTFILFFTTSFFCIQNATAQVEDKTPQTEEVKSDTITSKEIHLIVEQMPEFPGGVEAMIEYISNKLQYPPLVQATGAQGRVILRFVVGKDGKIQDVDILSNDLAFENKSLSKTINFMGVEKDLDIKTIQFIAAQEAMRVVKSMPKWNPGIKEGKPVSVYFTMPFSFRLK